MLWKRQKKQKIGLQNLSAMRIEPKLTYLRPRASENASKNHRKIWVPRADSMRYSPNLPIIKRWLCLSLCALIKSQTCIRDPPTFTSLIKSTSVYIHTTYHSGFWCNSSSATLYRFFLIISNISLQIEHQYCCSLAIHLLKIQARNKQWSLTGVNWSRKVGALWKFEMMLSGGYLAWICCDKEPAKAQRQANEKGENNVQQTAGRLNPTEMGKVCSTMRHKPWKAKLVATKGWIWNETTRSDHG
jgi:hypothetical protein